MKELTELERSLVAVVQATKPPRDARAVYRKLVRATMRDAVARQIPRAMECLGTSGFDHWVARFCEEALPRSQILRDVPYEFCIWAAPKWQKDTRLAPHLCDLARYELFEFDVYTARREAGGEPTGAPALDAALGVAFDGTARVARFAHTVHGAELEEREHGLFAYRNPDNALVQLELTPAATTFLMLLLLDGAALAAALDEACRLHDEPIDGRLIEATAQVLADLAERGVLLGPRAPGVLDPPSPFFRWLASGALV
jgi:hypothetical protein